jgi:transposase
LLPHVNGDWLQLYLQSLREHTGEDSLTLLLDNAPSHKNHAVVWPNGITPLYLPPYSPELNPAEQVFRQLRQWLANRVFTDLDDLQEALIATLHTFWDDPHLIIRLTHYPWWQAAIPPLLSLSS